MGGMDGGSHMWLFLTTSKSSNPQVCVHRWPPARDPLRRGHPEKIIRKTEGGGRGEGAEAMAGGRHGRGGGGGLRAVTAARTRVKTVMHGFVVDTLSGLWGAGVARRTEGVDGCTACAEDSKKRRPTSTKSDLTRHVLSVLFSSVALFCFVLPCRRSAPR